MNLRHAPTSTPLNDELRSRANTRIAGRWLFFARLLLVVVSIFYLVLYVIGTPVYFAYLHTLCTGCLDDRLTPDKLQALQALNISITTYAVYWVAINLLFALVYFAVAALIFWRKSDDWMAWLASFSLVAFGASFPSIPAVLAAVHPVWWLPVTLVGEDVLGFPSLVVFFYLFPTGRFVPRWTRWVVVGFVALHVINAFFPVSFLNFLTWPGLLILLVQLVVFGSLVFSQVYRYRRVSTPVERQQTKWIVFGAAVGLLGFLLLGVLLPALLEVFIHLQSLDLLLVVILVTGIYLVLLLIPLSFAIAILRYRLWDVDVLINKALVYGLLTGILVAVYAGCIVWLQALLRGLFNQTSEIAIVVSTLVIAALFQPLRKRIQAGIDRRFFRRKYDAAKTLEAFSATLRQEVDLNQLREELLVVVQETMQPAHVSLWLRPPEPSRKRQMWLLARIDEEKRVEP
jgi:hypothetical protein